MRKIAIILAGVLLTFGAYAADSTTGGAVAVTEVKTVVKEEVKPEFKPFSSWDFTGTNVEYKHTLYDNVLDTNYGGKDIDFILQVKKNLDENTWISASYDTDDSNPDTVVEILANRKFGKYIEAQLDLDLFTDGLQLAEDNDSKKNFIKYKATDNLSFKFAPYDIAFGLGTELDTDSHSKIPGIEAGYTVSKALSVYAGAASKSVSRVDVATSTAKDPTTAYGFKAGFGYIPSKDLNLTAGFSTSTEPDKDVAQGTVAPGKTAGNITLAYKAGKFGLNFESTYVGLNKAGNVTNLKNVTAAAADKTGTGIYAKLSYDLGKTIGGAGTVPYLFVKNYSEYFYFDDDDSYQNLAHGGLTIGAAGVSFKTERGITITPEFKVKSAKNKVYAGEKTAAYFATTVKVLF